MRAAPGMLVEPGALRAVPPVGHQQRDRLRVERDPALLVGLGVLLPRAPAALSDARRDDEDRRVRVEPRPNAAHTPRLAARRSS